MLSSNMLRPNLIPLIDVTFSTATQFNANWQSCPTLWLFRYPRTRRCDSSHWQDAGHSCRISSPLGRAAARL